jgi:hypothetical protein
MSRRVPAAAHRRASGRHPQVRDRQPHYFVATVPDRGDDRPTTPLATPRCWRCRFRALTASTSCSPTTALSSVGSTSPTSGDGEAEIGFRIGRDFAGRGLATEAVRRACHLARSVYGLKRMRAATTVDNHGSGLSCNAPASPLSAKPHWTAAPTTCSLLRLLTRAVPDRPPPAQRLGPYRPAPVPSRSSMRCSRPAGSRPASRPRPRRFPPRVGCCRPGTG